MPEDTFAYVVIGAGAAGASAVEGIREIDAAGSILLVGAEKQLPYERPPLSKQLWFGKARVEEIYLHDQAFYDKQNVRVLLGTEATKLDPAQKTVTTATGDTFHFDKLLLATGVAPRRLPIPGGDLAGISYFRTLDDYLQLRHQVARAKSVLVVGGGFIGSELSAALNISQEVTWIFPSGTLCSRVFPRALGQALQRQYQQRGVLVLPAETPVSIESRGAGYVVQTSSGRGIDADLIVVGIGTTPGVALAQDAGLEVGDGIVVNEYLQSSHPDIYAAGDNAFFPYAALGKKVRIEHWDNALTQGKWAGRNMAGAQQPFTYQPYFFSDLFEFGYEATGDVNAKLETFSDWEKENETGVIYYLADQRVRGVMACNVWDKMDAARELVRSGERVSPEELRGRIR
jgi:3-phenylpropionate/trans-cinnamate dioxygenase ferredoxin reductase subunit